MTSIQIEKEIFHSLKSAWPELKKCPKLEIPPNPEMGDLGICCFELSKKTEKSPEKIAEILAKNIKPTFLIEKAENCGPYLNLFLKKDIWCKAVFQEILALKTKKRNWQARLKNKKIKDKTILVEFSSPNTNKPQHLGHLRNNVLGAAISNLFSLLGAKVIRVNLINDRGIHIIKAMLGWKKWGFPKTPETEKKKGDHFVGDYYVLFEKKKKEIPALTEEAQEMLKKWEKGDPEVIALWQKINNWAIEGLFQTYKKIGVKFDKIYYESEVYKLGKNLVKKALKKGIAQKREDGAIEIDLGKLGKRVLLRADGTSVYITQDIGLAYQRFKEYHPYKSIYIVASEQDHYFQSLFKILELFGFSWVKNCFHLSYGMVHLPEGRMKSREGNVVDADDLIVKMEKLAEKEILNRSPDIDSKELSYRAEKIALSAIKFYLLYFKPSRNIVFKPEESISFEGATGPYLLYTYARAKSILEKSTQNGLENIDKINFSLLNKKEEVEILKLLFFWPQTIKESIEHYNPAHLAQMIMKLAQAFNEFYHSYKVIGDEKELEKARLLLVKAVAQILKDGLNLLGIETLEKM